MEIKQISEEIYDNNIAKGFYEKPVEVGTRLMLITSELAEALESDRKGKWLGASDSNVGAAIKNTLSNENIEWDEKLFETRVKDTVEDEIADAAIRLFDFAEHYGIDLEWHIAQKMRYNKLRPYKHGKKY
jgi:NTP pyrophosphatase (non-canonical NTP hydrolase)